MSESMVERVARAICESTESDIFDELEPRSIFRAVYIQQARAAIEAQVEWLREFGNHPPAPNCPRCNAADQITAALGEGE